jgi:hypothetical protein
MEINKENFREILLKFAKALNMTFPGLVVLEIFFKTGLLSKIPETIYEFLLFIVWSIALSTPYLLFVHPILDDYSKYSFTLHCKTKGKTKKESDECYNSQSKGDYDDMDNYNHQILFVFILFKVFITYILFKIFSFYQLDYTILEIKSNIWQAIMVIILTQIICYPCSYLFGKLALRKLKKYLERDYYN